MNEDFDLDSEFDFGDEDFAEEIADLEDSIDDDSDVMLRTAILQKDRMTALLCIKSATAGAAICRVDPRETFPAVQLYEDPDAAMLWFSRSLNSSRKNGWNVVYDGLPLEG
ncbi:MAG: hypothetical protein ABIR33_09005 [Pyrinomonadaceae bacterium]